MVGLSERVGEKDPNGMNAPKCQKGHRRRVNVIRLAQIERSADEISCGLNLDVE